MADGVLRWTGRRGAPSRSPALHRADYATVFAVALAARLFMIADCPGGFSGVFTYDSGVYYAASDAMLHGRLPYRDFVLLHPPGIAVLLMPFAVLGGFTSDHVGFLAAVLACSVLSALNAVLVVVIGRHLGLSRAGCVAGGLFFAVWFGTLSVDYGPRLEVFGSTLLLLALLAHLRGAAGWSGVALGAATAVKVWWVLPLVIVLGWLIRTDRARAARFAYGSAATLGVVVVPFAAVAPAAMWRMVVESQAIRTTTPTFAGHVRRLDVISSVQFAFPSLTRVQTDAALLVTGLLLAALGAAAWRCRPARIVVVIAAATVGALVVEPSYLSYYSAFAAAPLAVVVAAAVGTRRAGARRNSFGPPVGLLTVVVALVLTASGLARTGNTAILRVRDLAAARRAAGTSRCVVSDSPSVLIELDALSRGLADGCPQWVDVTGVTHVLDIAVGRETARTTDERWQAAIRRYLLSGTAVVTFRRLSGLSPTTVRLIDHLPVLARLGSLTLRAVPRPQPALAAPGTG